MLQTFFSTNKLWGFCQFICKENNRCWSERRSNRGQTAKYYNAHPKSIQTKSWTNRIFRLQNKSNIGISEVAKFCKDSRPHSSLPRVHSTKTKANGVPRKISKPHRTASTPRKHQAHGIPPFSTSQIHRLKVLEAFGTGKLEENAEELSAIWLIPNIQRNWLQ